MAALVSVVPSRFARIHINLGSCRVRDVAEGTIGILPLPVGPIEITNDFTPTGDVAGILAIIIVPKGSYIARSAAIDGPIIFTTNSGSASPTIRSSPTSCTSSNPTATLRVDPELIGAISAEHLIISIQFMVVLQHVKDINIGSAVSIARLRLAGLYTDGTTVVANSALRTSLNQRVRLDTG